MNKENYGDDYISSNNLLFKGKYVTIEVEIEDFFPRGTVRSKDGKLIPKSVIVVKGKESKKLSLCKTNEILITYATGEQPGKEWIGKRITLQARDVDSFGEKTPAIRIIPPKGVLIRKDIVKRMGTEAVWGGGPT